LFVIWNIGRKIDNIMELTKEQDKGFELITKALRKKFPYIKWVKVNKITRYTVYVDLGIEFFDFIEFYNLEMDEMFSRRGLSFILQYFKLSPTSYYPFVMLGDNDRKNFGIEFNAKMMEVMNILYSSLPYEYRINTKETEYIPSEPLEFNISNYHILVDTDNAPEELKTK